MSGSVLLSKFAVGQITVNIMVKESSELQSGGEVIIFNTEDGDVQVQVDTVKETVWMTQKGMAELFGVSVPAINQHVKNVYQEGELLEAATVKKNLIVQSEGSRKVQRNVDYYNLDMIIAVGYRVNSKRATAFRIWATKVLRDYLIKGFALDDNRFKRGQSLTHFKELIDRIREIRLSEKVFYQQIKDIYKLSEDYDPNDESTVMFFKRVQNKLLWAVSGKTAAELIYYRANSDLPQMGLTSTEVDGIVKSTDVGIGKNYLSKEEIEALKLIVEQYLSFAEAQAQAHRPMYMKDWMENLDLILQMNRRDILDGPGRISAELAKKKVRQVFSEYKEKQRHLEKIESLKELERDLSEYRKTSNSI